MKSSAFLLLNESDTLKLNLVVRHCLANTDFIPQEKQLEIGDRLDLSSYLLEPVQRLPRYKLFLDDLVKTYTSYENERCETDSRISHLSIDSDETGGSNGESSDNDETPLESLKLAKTVVEDMLTAVDGIMALENISECPVSDFYIYPLGDTGTDASSARAVRRLSTEMMMITIRYCVTIW